MGTRLEIYTDEKSAGLIIDIATNFKIDAQVIGRVEDFISKRLVIKSKEQELVY